MGSRHIVICFCFNDAIWLTAPQVQLLNIHGPGKFQGQHTLLITKSMFPLEDGGSLEGNPEFLELDRL